MLQETAFLVSYLDYNSSLSQSEATDSQKSRYFTPCLKDFAYLCRNQAALSEKRTKDVDISRMGVN